MVCNNIILYYSIRIQTSINYLYNKYLRSLGYYTGFPHLALLQAYSLCGCVSILNTDDDVRCRASTTVRTMRFYFLFIFYF